MPVYEKHGHRLMGKVKIMKFKRSACIEPMYFEIRFLERFAAAKEDGFDYVEFWSWTDKDLKAVRKAAEAAEIGICGFNGDAELSLIDPQHNDEYLQFLESSSQLPNCRCVKSDHSPNGLGEGGKVICDYRDLSDTVKTCNMWI